MSPTGDMVEVIARVPLSELFTYANEVRSLSQGRAATGIEPHSYEAAPDEVLRQLRGVNNWFDALNLALLARQHQPAINRAYRDAGCPSSPTASTSRTANPASSIRDSLPAA